MDPTNSVVLSSVSRDTECFPANPDLPLSMCTTYVEVDVKALLADLQRKHGQYLAQFVRQNSGPGPALAPPPSQPQATAMQVADPANAPAAAAAKTMERRSAPAPAPTAAKLKPKAAAPAPAPATNEVPIHVAESHAKQSPISSEQDDDFITVKTKSQKRKLKAPKPVDNPPKKLGLAVPSTSSRSEPRSQAAPEEESEDSPMTGPPKEKVPPLYIREKLSWQRMLPLLDEQGVSFETARSTAIGIRIDCPTADDHRRLTKILRQENVGFHTYALPEDKVYRAVIRGLPKELNVELIKADLLAQGLPVTEVHRMYHPRTKTPYEMVLVVLPNTPDGKKINTIKTVCRLSGLRIEPPNSRGRMGQCHRCQLYGHSARNCFAHPRCVKCLGDHGTADCPRTQPTEEPPSCVLCRTQGHPANYRGCPKAPREQKRRVKPAGRKPAPAPPAPRFVPAPAPATNAWDKPLPRPSAPAPNVAHATTAPSAKPAPPNKPGVATPNSGSTAADRAAANWQFIRFVLHSIDVEEMDAFTRHCKVDPTAAIQAHMDLLIRINKLEKTINGQFN